MKIIKAACALLLSSVISLNFLVYADSGITMEVSADKTENIAVGDVVSINITPQNITAEEGICSYDLGGIKFDSSVLAFDSENPWVEHQDFEIYAGENGSGNISLMVVDMSTAGAALHNGEGATTLKFTVIAEFEETTVSFADATVNATLANATLDSVSGTVSSDIVLYSAAAPETPSQTTESTASIASQTALSSDTGNTDDGGDNTVVIIAVVAVLLCAVGGVIFLLIKKKKD